MTTIKARGFVLRPLRASDTKQFYLTMQDAETQRNLSSFPRSLAAARREVGHMLLETRTHDSEIFTIEVRRRYAGNVVLEHQNHDPSSADGRVHLWIHPSFRGRGLATRALGRVVDYGLEGKFSRIYAQCKAGNAKVIRINRNLGFKRVRTFTDDDGIRRILWSKTLDHAIRRL